MSHTMPESPREITSIRYYDCGQCINQLAHVFKGHPNERRRFPAGVFLLEHSAEGLILFDTGYSRSIYHLGITGWLYNTLNPTTVTADNEIVAKLRADGIAVEDISYVILSHLHPDHIGGVKFFPHAKFLLSRSSYELLQHPRVKDLVFTRLLPDWFESRLEILDDFQVDAATGLASIQPFSDNSLVVVDLEGHARGQIGVLIPGKLLLAADACWGSDLVDYTPKMTPIAKLIQYDYHAYVTVLAKLAKLNRSGIKIYYSHEVYDIKELLS